MSTKVVSVRIDERLANVLDEVAAYMGLSRGKTLEAAIVMLSIDVVTGITGQTSSKTDDRTERRSETE